MSASMPSLWQRLTPPLFSGAAVVTALCCLGLSAAVSLATAVGATFLTSDDTLEPLLGITLAITVVGSALTYRRHRNPWPLVLTIAAAALIYGALYSGIGQAEHAVAEHPTVEHAAREHADEHATVEHATVEHATGEHAAGEHADEHATGEHAAQGEDGGGHGGASTTALVWTGLLVLVGAQVWDVVRVRALRRDREAAV